MILVLAEVVRNTSNVTENKKYKGDKSKQDFNVSKKGKKRY